MTKALIIGGGIGGPVAAMAVHGPVLLTGDAAPRQRVPVARVVRDLTMPLALKLFASKEAHAWMYTYHIGWER